MKRARHILMCWYLQNGFSDNEAKEFSGEDLMRIIDRVKQEYPNLNPALQASQVMRLARKESGR